MTTLYSLNVEGMSLLQRIEYVHFSSETLATVRTHNIPRELVINLDEIGLKLVPVGAWTMAPEGSRRVEIAGLEDKRQITAAFAGTLSEEFLPMQLLYLGKTHHCHPNFTFPDGFHIHHSPNHRANEDSVKLSLRK